MNTKKSPIVTLIGRMNVGKSTLFNRLVEKELAITSSWAGTTRDVHYGEVTWRGTQFTLVDTGGLDVEADEEVETQVIKKAKQAARESDVVLFVVDGKSGLLPQDKKLAEELKDLGVPLMLVVNKVDSVRKKNSVDSSVYQLTIEPSFFVSAASGYGTGDLLDGLYERIGKKVLDIADQARRTRVAIVGRPNVGKSSMLNAILGEDRVIVSSVAHTTRDTNDIPYTYKEKEFTLIDTAGIRRQSKVGTRWSDKRLGDIEKSSVEAAVSSMERADVVLLVVEAQERISAQDKHIAQLAHEYGKGLIIVINKWDLIEEKTPTTINEFRDYFDAALPFLRWAPMIFISAKEKLRVRETLDLVLKVSENYNKRIEAPELDSILATVASLYKPRQSGTRKGKKPVIKFREFTQIYSRPPRFRLEVSKPKDLPKALIDIAERELREKFDFEGVKIIIEVR